MKRLGVVSSSVVNGARRDEGWGVPSRLEEEDFGDDGPALERLATGDEDRDRFVGVLAELVVL